MNVCSVSETGFVDCATMRWCKRMRERWELRYGRFKAQRLSRGGTFAGAGTISAGKVGNDVV